MHDVKTCKREIEAACKHMPLHSLTGEHWYLQPTHERMALPCHSLLRPKCSL